MRLLESFSKILPFISVKMLMMINILWPQYCILHISVHILTPLWNLSKVTLFPLLKKLKWGLCSPFGSSRQNLNICCHWRWPALSSTSSTFSPARPKTKKLPPRGSTHIVPSWRATSAWWGTTGPKMSTTSRRPCRKSPSTCSRSGAPVEFAVKACWSNSSSSRDKIWSPSSPIGWNRALIR